MFNWDGEKSSKKLLIDEDELTVKVKDGSGFKTSLGDQVTIQVYSNCCKAFQSWGEILFLSLIKSRKSS